MKQYHVLLTLYRSFTASREKMAGIIAFAGQRPDWELHFIQNTFKGRQLKDALKTIRPDGAINVTPTTARLLDCPIVLTDNTGTCKKHDAVLTCDDQSVGRAAANDLFQRGFRRFAYVGPSSKNDARHSKARYDAFCGELARQGVAESIPSIFHDYFTSLHDRDSTRLAGWLQALPKPCGLFVYNDFLCQCILPVCRRVGIRMPEQIGVLGVDNETEICEHASPTLSSIELDFFGAGFAAAKILDGFMRTKPPKKPQIHYYGIKGIRARMSTQNVVGSMRIVSAVMERIRRSDGKGISAPLLAKEFGISTRMLEYRFKNGHGTTIHEEITKARIATAKRLLSTTALPIGDISFEAGLGTADNLRFVFAKYLGTTPSRFRKENTMR